MSYNKVQDEQRRAMEIDRYLARREQKRRQALSSQDAKRYFSLCDELGVEPEDEHLYERGYADNYSEQKKLEELLEPVRERDKYRKLERFVREGAPYARNVFAYPDEQSKLLVKYFPKFSNKGHQPISRFSDGQRSAIFKGVYESALRQIREYKD